MRKQALPQGWYPSSAEEIHGKIEEWKRLWPADDCMRRAVSGLVPHAGWYFCGSLIFQVINQLPENIETVVILGGHNPAGAALIAYQEEFWDSPTGTRRRDVLLSDQVDRLLGGRWDQIPENTVDNTVEVVFAMLAAMLPDTQWAAWRVPADERAVDFGAVIAEAAEVSGRKVAVLGSTDLTHYGTNYGFHPQESLHDPVFWVEKNDKRFLEALESMESEKALELANATKAACSVGAALAAMGFAQRRGAVSGRVLEYSTSFKKLAAESFVGYGALVWEST